MRIKKLMYDSFYSNNEAFSGVTSVESLGSDLYFHYIKQSSGHYKLSGNTAALASGVIFEDSVTTSITVSPALSYQYSGLTVQISVVNQDNVDVLSECIILSSNTVVGQTGATKGLITITNTGVTTINVTHNDGPTGSATVTGYWPGPVTITPLVATGVTGTTLQFTLTSDPTGRNITSLATWTSSATGVTITSVTPHGLATIAAHAGSTATITATYGALTGSAYAPVRTLTISGA
jgi:hypothetical protein